MTKRRAGPNRLWWRQGSGHARFDLLTLTSILISNYLIFEPKKYKDSPLKCPKTCKRHVNDNSNRWCAEIDRPTPDIRPGVFKPEVISLVLYKPSSQNRNSDTFTCVFEYATLNKLNVENCRHWQQSRVSDIANLLSMGSVSFLLTVDVGGSWR